MTHPQRLSYRHLKKNGMGPEEVGTISNSSSGGSKTLFWPRWVPGIQVVQINIKAEHPYT